MPSAAWREWQTAPHGLLETITLYRAYARAKVAYDQIGDLQAGQRAALLADPIVQLVREVDFALAEQAHVTPAEH